MSVKHGTIINNHPYVDILVSANPSAQLHQKHTALIDTGFSGFVSTPIMGATLLGLKAHTATQYVLANGKVSDPVPLAYGFACLESDSFVPGLISLSQNTSTAVGMDFILRCGKALVLMSKSVAMIDGPEFIEALKHAAENE